MTVRLPVQLTPEERFSPLHPLRIPACLEQGVVVVDVEEVVRGPALVRRPLVVRLGDLVAHPVAQVGGPAGGGQAVVEPPAVVGPVLRLLELHPELPLVPVAIPI